METMIFKCIVGGFTLIGVILASNLISYIANLKNNAKYSFIYDIVSIAVSGVEQYAKGYYTYKRSGSEKREDATKFIKDMLKEYGITLTDDAIRMLLESAVYDMNKDKEENDGERTIKT